MNALPLRRVAYEDKSAVPPRPRSGSAAREEVNVDFNDYVLPLARMLFGIGQTWGVGAGLEVSADANGTEIRIAPGVAVDGLGRILSLADKGKAIVATDVSPDAVTDVATVDVAPAGVTLATTGAAGENLLTMRWREVQVASPSQLFLHTPWLALVKVGGFVDDDTHVVLAVVRLDPNGKVLALGAGGPAPNPGRRTLDSHTGALELRRPREASALSVDQVPAGQLRARPDGGLELNLLTPARTVLSVSPTGAVSLAPASGGSVGIGLGGRAPMRALHVEGNEIHSGGPGGGLSFADRNSNAGAYVDNPGATGARWVWYSSQKSARLWSGSDRFTIDAAGNIGVGTSAPRAGIHSERGQTNVPALLLAADGPGWGSGVQLDNQSADGRTYGVYSGSDGRLHISDVGDLKDRLVIDGVGNVGLGGISAPGRPLHVLGEAHVGGRGAAVSFGDPAANGIVDNPTNGERWKWYVQGGEARLWSGKDRLRINNTEGGGLDVGRRMRMRQGGDGSAGTWLNQDAAGDRAFIGMAGDTMVGFYGVSSDWSLLMDTDSGAVGIGTNAPQRMLHVEERGLMSEIHSGGGGRGGFSMGIEGAFVQSPANGERYVWYASGGKALLWSNDVLMSVDNAGNLWIKGKLSKSLTQFKIDHPLDPENKYLVHSGIESDRMRNLYDGRIQLDDDGVGVIDLPDWFDALNTDLCYQLTSVGVPAPDLHVAQELADNSFRIAGGPPGATVCWQVTGVRHDAYAVAEPMVVEEDKPDEEKGTLIHPEAHGDSADKGAFRKAGDSKSNAAPPTFTPPTGP